jgi:ERCC4-type nuclease
MKMIKQRKYKARKKKEPAEIEVSDDSFMVIRDSREQEGWFFTKKDRCLGTEIQTLPTADYTIVGCEDFFVIERKGCITEFVKNINEPRFYNELSRLKKIKYSFIFLEFSIKDVDDWPRSSGLSEHIQAKIRTSRDLIYRRINEIMIKYGVQILFVEDKGKEMALSLFKRMAEVRECQK